MLADQASPLRDAIQTVRGELARIDAKAATLLAAAGFVLSLGLPALARADLPGLAVAAGWLAATAIGAAVLVLALAIRPNLHGDHGFVHYARSSGAAIRDEFNRLHRGANDAITAHERRKSEALAALSRAAFGKYRRVRAGVDLLLTGLALTALAAVLAAAF
jgi:hypothetical protein